MKQNSSTEKGKNSGFTLVELIVVIAILAILAAVAYPVYTGYIKKAQEAADLALLGAVNEAFRSACIDEGISGLPEEAVATLSNKKVSKVTVAGADNFNDSFSRYFQGNEDKKFNVYEGLLYNKEQGFYGSMNGGNTFIFADGSRLTNKGTGADGNTTWTWEKDGHTYEIVINEAEAEAFNNSFGKNISIGGLMDEVNNVAGAAQVQMKSLPPVMYNMMKDELAPYLAMAGIDESSPDYEQALANALVLGTAEMLSEYSVEELYDAVNGGSFAVKPGHFGVGTAAGLALNYSAVTGYANSPDGKTNMVTDPSTGEEMTVQQYYSEISAKLSTVSNASEAGDLVKQMNETIMKSAGYKSYMAVNGEDDMAGLLAAMKSINSNSEALAESGVLTSGFGDDSVKDVLGALFS